MGSRDYWPAIDYGILEYPRRDLEVYVGELRTLLGEPFSVGLLEYNYDPNQSSGYDSDGPLHSMTINVSW